MMDKKKFYDSLRGSVMFGASLSQAQVEGCDAILESCALKRVTDPHHVAHILAHVAHETGGYMLPIKETVMAHHKNKNPSDATVIARLDRAYAKGKLPWVKKPYWRDGAFGRGPIQTTHWDGYIRIGKRLGLPLRSKPELLLIPMHGADSAVVGMAEGIYTGKKLSDYSFPSALSAPWRKHPRRIVNGNDGTDATIAEFHLSFYSALITAGWAVAPLAVPKPKPKPPAVEVPPPPPEPPKPQPNYWAALFGRLFRIWRSK